MKSIDFWFTIGSTYTYLSVMRLEAVAKETGISFNYRPFSVLEIMLEMDNIPFLEKPIKSQNMWRDIERRAEKYGCPAKLPAPYPPERAECDLANWVAVVGREEGWSINICSPHMKSCFNTANRPAATPISATACARSARIRPGSSRAQKAPK